MSPGKSVVKNKTVNTQDGQTFRFIFEHHAAVMMLIEPETGAILDANHAAVSFYGYPKSTLCTMSINEINTLPQDQIVLELHRAMTEERNYFHFSHRLANGEVRLVEVHSSPIAVQDRRILFSIIHDITERKRTEAALRESEEQYRALMEQASDGIFIANQEGQYINVNSAGCKLLGYTREEILNLHMRDLTKLSEDAPLRFQELREGKIVLSEREMIRKDGTLVPVEISAKQLPDGRLQGIVRDITKRREVEDQLRQLSQAVEQSPLAILITDKDGKIEYTNPRFTTLTGYTLDEVRGQTPHLLVSDQTESAAYPVFFQTILSGREWRGESLNRKKNGETYWGYVSISSIIGSNGDVTHFVAVTEDITARKEAEEKIQRLNAELEQLALTDHLTNLYNRRYFMQRGIEELKSAKRNKWPLALLVMDIDEFKKINDTFGHETGDKALQLAANALKSSLRETDVLGRLGGDEFVILLPQTSVQEALLLTERIHRNIAAIRLETPQGRLSLTMSIGIAESNQGTDSDTVENLLVRGDRALYAAKQGGRNRTVIYDPAQQGKIYGP
ncbi:MAG: PAS domain S-box protein [Chloroflexi bacterium]|nr:PAS domain S-box protein [Chloroflexota bacterium]